MTGPKVVPRPAIELILWSAVVMTGGVKGRRLCVPAAHGEA